ncbi:hypothetical protein BB561_000903 [Smittium simulii]|uniref:J domain-containing protein n=1 Tax=Smittium simulii TaxID=133385 RepID=A0A2T9YX76_9FUNG|nr:hypothetical protein BB561_000903 [Smittium simulii]
MVIVKTRNDTVDELLCSAAINHGTMATRSDSDPESAKGIDKAHNLDTDSSNVRKINAIKTKIEIILQNKSNYYTIFDLDPTCSDSDIKQSYKNTAKLIHPDKCALPQAEEAFKVASNAFEILSSTTKRKDYDAQLLRKLNMEQHKNSPIISGSTKLYTQRYAYNSAQNANIRKEFADDYTNYSTRKKFTSRSRRREKTRDAKSSSTERKQKYRNSPKVTRRGTRRILIFNQVRELYKIAGLRRPS